MEKPPYELVFLLVLVIISINTINNMFKKHYYQTVSCDFGKKKKNTEEERRWGLVLKC